MMHSTYSSYSSIVSLKTTNFVFNDCNSCNYPNERCPSSYNCSCCCSFPVNYTRLVMPMNLNPSLLYGLRQSTLIQWPPYRRRVVLGSSDRYCYRPSIYEAGRCCYCVESCGVRKGRVVGRGCIEKCCVEKRGNLGGDGVLGRRGNKGYFVEESRSNGGDKIKGRVIRRERDFRCNALGDAEAMLSLLCEEGVKECVPVRERKKSLSKEAKVVREENVVSETGKDGKGNVLSGSRYSESESRRQSAESSMAHFREEGLKRRDERESLSIHLSGSRYLESESKRQSAESRRAHFRQEGLMRRDERESLSIHENERLRRRESCSSYYSLSDSDEYQSDSDVDVKQEIFVGDSSTSQGTDLRKTGGVVISEVTKDDSKSYRDEEDDRLISSRHDSVRKGSSAEWDWRKKSEKKLTDDSTEVNKFGRKSIAQHSNLSKVNNSSSVMASSSKKQFSNLKMESTSDVSSCRQSRYSTRKDDQTSEYVTSRARYEHSTTDGRYPEYSESQVAIGNQMSEQVVSHGQHELSTSAASSSGQLKAQITTDNQKSDYLKSNRRHEQSSRTNRQNVQSTSTTEGRLIQGQGATVVDQSVQETGCDYCISCGRSKEIAKLEVDIQQGTHSAEFSEIHGDARWNTATRTAQSQSESRHIKQQTSTSSFQRLAEESKQQDERHRAGQFDARMDSGYRFDESIRHSETMGSDYRCDQSMKHSETVHSDYRYDQSVRSEKKEEMRVKHLDASISRKSPQAVKKSQEGSVGRVTNENESCKLLQTGATASQVSSASIETSRRSASENIINVEHTISTTKLKSVEESVEKHELVDKTFMRTKLRTEVQGPVLQVGSIAEFSGEGNASQPTVGSTAETRVPRMSQAEIKSDLQLIETSPSYHSLERTSTDSEPESSLVRKITGRTTKVDSGSGYSLSEGTKTSSSDEANERFVAESSPEDTISSAERMQESSTQIVDEFVEKMRHESSASQIKIEKELSHADKKQKQKESTQPQTEKAILSKQDLSHVAGSSVTEELLDNVWGVKDHSVEEAPDSGSSKEEMSGSVVTRRTGKSLWNVVAGVIRLRWRSSSEPQKSPVKSSQRSSSSGETWFSGNESDEGTDDSMKRQRLSMSQEPTSSNQPLTTKASTKSRQEDRKKKQSIGPPQAPASDQSPLGRTATKSHKKDRRKKEQRSLSQEPTLDQSSPRRIASRSQKEESTLVGLDERLSPVEVDVSPSLNVAQGGSIAAGVDISESTGIMIQQTSMPSPLRSSVKSARQFRRSDALEEIEVVGKIEERMSSTSEQSDSSRQDLMVPSARRLKRSDVFNEIVEVGRTEELISSISELEGHSVDVMEGGIPTAEETDAELRRRKLQRSKQVLSDRFDEWEDAYRRENEQRKVDEIFMREALAEAIRAADSWEVPVGAVLVQNGKIIARGYNLVEELRDSTAHAEMICIREASNVLRTWRLSETTLYVTLEPCPMCAGAILQARIKTLVWGAPNKLLGADGSWIRLFPEGVEGEQRTEVADKPAAPQHPFHPKMNIRRGILESECAQIMQQFFQLRRRKETEKKKKSEEESQASCLPVPHNPAKLLRKMHGVFHHT